MPGKPRNWTCQWLGIACCLAVTMLPLAVARAEVTVQDNGAYVIDLAGLLDPGTKANLENWLRELEQKTTAQVKLLTVKTAEGEDIESFAQRHFDLWKLGQKGKDNGALLVLDLAGRQFRIRTGYGLEGTLPDSWCGTVSRKFGRPRFQQGQFALGLQDITIAVANKIADEAGVKLTGIPDVRLVEPPTLPVGLVILLVIVVIVLMWYASKQNRRGRGTSGGWNGPWIGPSDFGGGFGGFRGGRGGGGFGGSFGGGGGGFGGSFGGGGRSGGGGGGTGW